MEISKGKKPSAQKIVLFAPEGWGKSTAASKMPSPLFLDTEGSTKQLNVEAKIFTASAKEKIEATGGKAEVK